MKLSGKPGFHFSPRLSQRQSTNLTFIAISMALLLAAFFMMFTQYQLLEAKKCQPSDKMEAVKSLSLVYPQSGEYLKYEICHTNIPRIYRDNPAIIL